MRAVPFAPPDIADEDVEAVAAVLRGGWLTTGEECRKLEDELAAFLEVPHVVALSSCTAALQTALAYLRLPPGSLVAVPTWTFVATGLAAHAVGARPLLVDVNDHDLNMSLDSLIAAMETHDVAAVVPVHLGGVPVSNDIFDVCAERGVHVVEDAAHALGARRDDHPVNGSRATAACFSFYASKNLTSGEGGALSTSDDELAAFARSFRLHGLDERAVDRYRPGAVVIYDLVAPGIKANFPDVLAALARSQLNRFPAMQARRRSLVSRYRANLSPMSGVEVLPPVPDEGSADHLLIVAIDAEIDRRALRDRLAADQISTSVHFPPLHRYRWFAEHAVIAAGGLPGADRMAERALSLPLHPGLRDEDVDYVCDALAGALAAL